MKEGMLCLAIVQALIVAAGVCGDVLRYTESGLLGSPVWQEGSARLVLLTADEHSSDDVAALQALLGSAETSVVMVECSENGGDVCNLLSASGVGVRVVGGVRGVSVGTDTTLVTAVLEALLGPRLLRVDHAHSLKLFAEEHEEFFLILTLQPDSQDYHTLLASILTVGTYPLLVATAAELLPLQHRPWHSLPPAPMTLWFVSGLLWIPAHRYHANEADWIADFVKRAELPVVVSYEGRESVAVFAGHRLHVVYLFSGLSPNSLDCQLLAEALLKECFTHFAFVTVERADHPELAREHFVDDANPLPQVVIVPPDQDVGGLVNIEVPTTDLAMEAGLLAELLLSHLAEGGVASTNLSITDPFTLRLLVRDETFHILAVFCASAVSSCPGDHYVRLERAMKLLEEGGVSGVTGFVVQCDSVADLARFKLNSLPSYAYYNRSEGVWRCEGGEGGASDYLALIAASTGLPAAADLNGQAEHGRTERSDAPPPSFSHQHHEEPAALREDDQFGLLSRSLPPALPPPHLELGAATFDLHLERFQTTLVVFHLKWCVKSQVFLQHVLAAMDGVEDTPRSSIATVDCAGYPDVCQRFTITTLPSALVFHSSHPHTPTPLPTGTLDSQSLLAALKELQPQTTDLMEATPSSLPALLRGSLATPLVLWCDSHVTADVADKFSELALVYPHLSFAWINSSRTGGWQGACPGVLAIKLAEHVVYEAGASLSSLEQFLKQFSSGAVEPTGSLGHWEWLPQQPPVPFPSSEMQHLPEHTSPPPPPDSPPSHYHSEL